MILPCGCPVCSREDCVTLRELARVRPRGFLSAFVTRKLVERVVTGYLQECPDCHSIFAVTLGGVRRVGSAAPTSQTEVDDQGNPRKPRPQQPAWKAPPGL